MTGSLDASLVRFGKPRGSYGLRQRRVRPGVFGEPAFVCELVLESLCAARPHAIAYGAWSQLNARAFADGCDQTHLAIYSAYRPVALQAEIWAYRLAERRRLQPELSEAQAARVQQKWTAKPGRSAHHTGFALDLGLYHLGNRLARRTPTYRWLAHHAADFGFYPYLPEAWHWEFNPPGLVEQLRELRRRLSAGEPAAELLRPRLPPSGEKG